MSAFHFGTSSRSSDGIPLEIARARGALAVSKSKCSISQNLPCRPRRAARRTRRRLAALMKRERVALVDEAHLVRDAAARTPSMSETAFATMGALEIGELDEHDRGGPRVPWWATRQSVSVAPRQDRTAACTRV
jgi:hypothetical protein